ncbi:putative mitochondrial carrier (TC 2.A.29) family protein [Lyophyllum shimeji]|uniref:Mitochondrial carrier (TC 2.A.29) family protein n=1 Tax=Lyophyllum shimeji TaxID=47721 RepID=A0A9P3PMM3_LYOSH|nr:putative mitochondrial carrier (TC 2.A.29) family protein [Lyophyllum shimeji]
MPPPIDDSVVLEPPHPPGDTLGPDNAALFTFSSALKNIAFGSFAGMVSEVFEYPFDLAKVRLQAQLLSPAASPSQLRFKGPVDCLKQTWREEGPRGLYRGLTAPIVGSMAETAALFVAYSGFQDIIRAFTSRSRTDKLSIPELGIAAAGAGFVSSFIITPVELVKCKMQVQMMNMPKQQRYISHRPLLASLSPSRLFLLPTLSTGRASISKPPSSHSHSSATAIQYPPGPLGVIRETVQAHGIRGLWLGHTGTLVRETGGTAAWFAVKELVADTLLRRRRGREASQTYAQHSLSQSSSSNVGLATELQPWESAFAGAVAGGACVLAFYPADTVKSAMQTEDELRPSGARAAPLSKQAAAARSSSQTFTGTLVRMYSAHGLRGLYAGCGMTVARAVPSSGIVFVVYDGLAAWLG